MKINKDRIKLLIKKKSMKQKDVAAALGVGPQDFNNWMFRGIFPHYDKLEILADLLDVDVYTLHKEQIVMDPIVQYGQGSRLKTDSFIPFYEPGQDFDLALFDINKKPNSPKDLIHVPGVKADLFYPYYGKNLFSLSNGDLVALKLIEDISILDLNLVYAICANDQVIFRLLKEGDNQTTLLLLKNEEDESPQDIMRNSIKALYAVKAVIKRNI